MLGSARA